VKATEEANERKTFQDLSPVDVAGFFRNITGKI
jgi:hypothetical protein